MQRIKRVDDWGLIGCALAGAFVALLGYSITEAVAPTYDIYWHIALGKTIVEQRIFPLVDDFSFTAIGGELSEFPFLFDMAMYKLDRWFGLDLASHLYLYVCLLSVVLLAWLYLRKIGAGLWVSLMLLLSLAVAMVFRNLVRPEVFSYVLVVAAFYLYKQCLERFSVRSYLQVFALLLFWVNYHTAILAYVIFGGMYADLLVKNIINKAGPREWSVWFSSGLLLLLVGFVSPFFNHPLLSFIGSDPRWFAAIAEYMNIFYQIGNNPAVLLYVVALVLAIALSVRGRRLGYLIILLTMSIAAISMNRMITAAFIIIMLILAELLSDNKLRVTIPAKADKLIACVPAVLSISMLFYYAHLFFILKPHPSSQPTKAVTYIKSSGAAGNIINEYETGGYLIYQLYPGSRVYIDGRAGILYDYEVYQRLKNLLTDPDLLRKELEEHDVSMMLVKSTFDREEVVYKSGRMSLDYADNGYSLYVKTPGKLALLGYLRANPACWSEGMKQKLYMEQTIANRLNGLDPDFRDFMETVTGFPDVENKARLFDDISEDNASNSVRRFLAYQALSLNNYAAAKKMFSSIYHSQSNDYLALTYSLMMEGDYKEAESVLRGILQGQWGYVDDHDRLIMMLIANQLKKSIPLESIDSRILDALRSDLHAKNLSLNGISLDYSVFCERSGLSDYSITASGIQEDRSNDG